MEAQIPFAGFYESFFSQELDEQESQTAEHLAEEHQVPIDKVRDILWHHSNHTEAYPDICEVYVDNFNSLLNDHFQLDMKMEFTVMSSPKYYNFETDRIFAKISVEDSYALYRKVGKKAVRAMAKKMFTSCDGFISHYDPDIDEWGQLRTWDYNQMGALMRAAIKIVDADDYVFYEDMYETISNAYQKAVDWDEVKFEIGKLVGRKELEEEMMEEDDGRRFPVTWYNTQDYVNKYLELNKTRSK